MEGELQERGSHQVKPVGSCTCSCINHSLKTAGEQLQLRGAGLEFGKVSRCYPVPYKERIMNLTRLGIWNKVILWKTVTYSLNKEAIVALLKSFYAISEFLKWDPMYTAASLTIPNNVKLKTKVNESPLYSTWTINVLQNMTAFCL